MNRNSNSGSKELETRKLEKYYLKNIYSEVQEKLNLYKNKFEINLCDKCGLPYKVYEKHQCIEKNKQNNNVISDYLFSLNKQVEDEVDQIINENHNLFENNKIFIDNIIDKMSEEVKENLRLNTKNIQNSIIEKEESLNTLNKDINKLKNEVKELERTLELNEKINDNDIDNRFNNIKLIGEQKINEILIQYIHNKNIFLEKSNNVQNNIYDNELNKNNEEINKKCLNNKESSENQNNILIHKCNNCFKEINNNNVHNCFYSECKKKYCDECYSKNKNQVKANNISCSFFKCRQCKLDNICILSTRFCIDCGFRICSNCYNKTHNHN